MAIVYFLLGPLVTVWKSGSDVLIRPYSVLPEIRSELLISVNYANRKYIINKVTRAFFVLRDLKSAQPDLYKLGYKLKELLWNLGRLNSLLRNSDTLDVTGYLANLNFLYLSKELKDAEVECRMCKDIEPTRDNPLVSPCKCSGSVKCVHIECIKVWYSSRTK